MINPVQSILKSLVGVLLPCLSHIAQDGRTALTHAAREGHIECVRLLLQLGADQNSNGDFVRDMERRVPVCVVYVFVWGG